MIKKIAIIEDNQEIIQFIDDYLKEIGDFDVQGYHSGADALRNLKISKPDLALVDLELGDIRGETVCTELRKVYSDNDLPIIILTGDKSQESIVRCLNAGADDYVTKPFNADVLLARINARLRNTHMIPATQVLTCGDLELNMETLEATRAGKRIDLTAKEFELLKYLLINKDRILTREKLLNAVWGYTAIVDTRVVDVHIGKLRKKIEEGFAYPLIETMRGFGYKIVGQ
jgi:DNA-binding response OmpR family regulator